MRKRLIFGLLLVMLFAFAPLAQASVQTEFIDRMGPLAQEIAPQYSIPPSAFLGQAAVESGWGTSWLAQNAKNYFGRKCLADPCVVVETPEYRDGVRVIESHSFQVYESLEAAVHGYCKQFYRTWASGARIYEFDGSSPEAFIRSIAPRYATDPRYAEKVLSVIREYDLEEWDKKKSENTE
jgi:flagellum-specific peptidoglycan hydrolase FlgJ